MKNFKKNCLYKIRFYDHHMGSHDKMVCEAVGWVVEQDTHHVVLTSWLTITKDEDIKKANLEPVSIIKSCIIRSRKFV